MNKSTDFIGQPIFSQLLSLLDQSIIKQSIREHKANRCYKKLFLWDHLVSMLYGIYTNCTSLREIQYGLEVCQGKLNHINLSRVPPRSTLSDGNKRRPAKVFGTVYQKLYNFYKHSISDSRLKTILVKRLYVLDSTTISLFKAILKPAGRKRKDERIEVIYTLNKEEIKQQMRRVVTFSAQYQKAFVYVTNNFELTAIAVAAIYFNRWQIKVFFKKLKQNFPLTYFFGDNANAIEIQIWYALIALLLLDVTHKEHKSKMAFSILASIVRLHIMNYVGLSAIIETYKLKRKRIKSTAHPNLFSKKIIPPAFQIKLKM